MEDFFIALDRCNFGNDLSFSLGKHNLCVLDTFGTGVQFTLKGLSLHLEVPDIGFDNFDFCKCEEVFRSQSVFFGVAALAGFQNVFDFVYLKVKQ
jgi:hypothetical protein